MLKIRKEASLLSRHEAFPYQVETVESIKALTYAAIFHEQGLGKTKIAIDLSLTWISENRVDSIVIITKKGLIKNWENEIDSHSFLKAKTVDQDSRTQFYAFNSPARIYLTHYEVCKSSEKAFALFLKTRRVGVICDESHKFKNPESSIAKSLHRLGPGFTTRVIMSGTPIANRPYDIWSQIFFLDGGQSLGVDFKTFREQLDFPKKTSDKAAQGLFAKELSKVFSRIKSFTVRETKASSGLSLPTKHIENVTVDLEAAQLALYQQVRHDLKLEVVKNGKNITDDVESILKRLLRLVQIASNPRLVDESFNTEPAKMFVLKRLLAKASSTQSKTIVWTSFTDNADWLCKALQSYGAVKVHGKMAIKERNVSIESFKKDINCRVLVATPGAAKEGLTLTVANHAIFYDRSFSLDDYLQAQDRIHRISQKEPCYIYNLLARNSIDEWVDELLAAKHVAAKLGQGDIDRNQFTQEISFAFTTMLQEVLGFSQQGS
jgi:SNF2 family DNA or RNA helicase